MEGIATKGVDHIAGVGISVIATWLYNAAGGRVLVPVAFHTLSNAVSVTTVSGVVGDEVLSQVGLLVVVWVVVAVLVWRYGTDRLASKPLPDGGLDFDTRDDSGRRSTPW